MEILHYSREAEYRDPFGAAPAGASVRLAVKVGDPGSVRGAYLCYAYGLREFAWGRYGLEQSGEDPHTFAGLLRMPDEPCLLFYWFEIFDGTTAAYGLRNTAAGDGSCAVRKSAPSFPQDGGGFAEAFQITVYDRGFKTPDWLKGAVLYQIFPDRFARASDFSYDAMRKVRDLPDRICHKDWHEEVDYRGKDGRSYTASDFFGGSLRGIIENLDHLESLGVGVLYLNPIFESRSNHRYDTGNYEKVDPLLGNEQDLEDLVRECGRRSIRVILDGVFSHTGADSVYFNKYGTYPDAGAYQDASGGGKSRYYTWYSFQMQHGYISYDSWWGFPDLPNVNENDLRFREYILGEDGIVRRWLRKGIAGWRLDVSDELPDGFLRELRRAAKNEREDAAILGEVWEDASCKSSYGHYRDFLFGNTHDCVMGYPFRKTVMDWLCRRIGTDSLIHSFETIRENYPVQAYLCNMNLIGSHDVARAITELAGPPAGDRQWQASAVLSDDARRKGLRLLKLAMLIQFTFPGVPSVYYGDEAAMEGYGDPFCRRTADVPEIRRTRPEIYQWLAAISAFRTAHPMLRTGHIGYLAPSGGVLLYRRYLAGGLDMAGTAMPDESEFLVAVNPGDSGRTVEWSGRSFDLGPMRGVILHDGARVFEA